MGQAIGDLLPSAIGVALSPVPIIAVILMLGTPKARSNGPAFAVGWVLGLVVVSVIVVLVAGDSDDPDSGSSTAVDSVKLLLGVLFLAAGAASSGRAAEARVEPDDAEVDGDDRLVHRRQVARARRRPLGRQPEEPGADARRRGVDRPGRARRRRDRRRRSPCSSSSAR